MHSHRSSDTKLEVHDWSVAHVHDHVRRIWWGSVFDTFSVFISIMMVVPQAEETSEQTTHIDVFNMCIKQRDTYGRDTSVIKQSLAVGKQSWFGLM